MANSNYLKPKAPLGKLHVERKRGQFVNVDSYPHLGGFTSASKRKPHDPSMSLEKGGPSAKKGNPI